MGERGSVESELEISVVMPCLNEARTLPACIAAAKRAIEQHGLAAEIIVADNGSTDGSIDIATNLGARVVDVHERGYGAALLGGIEAARGRFILMADADESYDFGELWPFVERLRQGDDLVMGCRLPRGGGSIDEGAMPWKHRWIGNPVLSAFGRILFKSPVTDFHCGMRAFRRDFILDLGLRTTGMEFASEMVIKATVQGGHISEVPITLHRDGRDRPPHLRSWRDGWRHLRFMLLMSPRWLFLAPGIGMFIAGAIVTVILIPGPFFIGHTGLGTTTMLVAAMVLLLGFQLIVYALFSRIFAVTEGLLQPEPSMVKLFGVITLEVGVLVGFVFALGGLSLLVYETAGWAREGFGPLNYWETQRIVIPAVTAIILGVQIVFASFFLSVLGLRRR